MAQIQAGIKDENSRKSQKMVRFIEKRARISSISAQMITPMTSSILDPLSFNCNDDNDTPIWDYKLAG